MDKGMEVFTELVAKEAQPKVRTEDPSDVTATLNRTETTVMETGEKVCHANPEAVSNTADINNALMDDAQSKACTTECNVPIVEQQNKVLPMETANTMDAMPAEEIATTEKRETAPVQVTEAIETVPKTLSTENAGESVGRAQELHIVSDILLPRVDEQMKSGIIPGDVVAQQANEVNPIATEQENDPMPAIADDKVDANENSNVTTILASKAPAPNDNPINPAPVITSGLSLLAQYNSSSDDDDDNASVVEVPVQTNYRNQVVEIDSDTDSSSSDSDVEYLNELRKKIDKRIQCDDDSDCDDDDEDGTAGNKTRRHQPPKVKGELLLEDLPPIQDLHITVPEEECVELGRVHSIVDQLLLVNALPNSILLNLDTVLFLEKGKKVLGKVFDVLGQVADPLYCVRFNSNKQIQERNIKVGDVVYVAPKTEHTQYVILSSLMTMRGSDASWENDVEPPPKCLDYSDDEEERLARQRMRNKKRAASRNGDDAVETIDDSDDDDRASVYSAAESTNSTQYGGRGRRQNYRQDRRRGGGSTHNGSTAGQNSYQQRSRHNNNYNNNGNYQRSDSWHNNFHPHSNQMRQDAPYYGAHTNAPAPYYGDGAMPQVYNPFAMPPQMPYPMAAPAMGTYPQPMYPYGMSASAAPPQHMQPPPQQLPAHFAEPPPPGE